MAKLKVNGEVLDVEADENTPLLWVLREQLGLTGTKYGCGVAQCGACTVHVGGQAIRSCVYPLAAVTEDDEITTIEGLSENGDHPVQQAWREVQVPQCGFCQAGQIMQAASLLAEKANPSDQEILDGMAGNICRCGCYERIVAAVRVASTGT